jgi:GNAT superfamily N-acetyltransferase
MEPRFSAVTGDGRRWTVRPYRDADRARVRSICCETGFVGRPMAPVFEGTEEFADLFCSYNTDYEFEHCFVAEVEGRVEGYLLGCPDSSRQDEISARAIMPMIRRKAWRNGWLKSRKNLGFLLRSYRSRLRGELDEPRAEILRDYPAHLHINIADSTLRGQGVGKALMAVYLDHLRGLRVRGVHLGTTDHNLEAISFYNRLGFKVIFKRRITLYDHILPPPVHHVIYGMDLRK